MGTTRRILFAFSFGTCLASAAQAQSSVFFGSVVADGELSPPLRDAEVVIPALHLEARTDTLGKFIFQGIPRGVPPHSAHSQGAVNISVH